MLTSLYQRVTGFNDMALRLFASCGQVADQTGHAELAYEFFAQAFTVYEEVISDSRAQFQAICVLAGALHSTRGFARDDYDTLITKCALHGSKLLKKPDQCRAVYLASHLWWATEIRSLGEEDGKEASDDLMYVRLILTRFSFTAMERGCWSVCSGKFFFTLHMMKLHLCWIRWVNRCVIVGTIDNKD
jgi:hypothetical protein